MQPRPPPLPTGPRRRLFRSPYGCHARLRHARCTQQLVVKVLLIVIDGAAPRVVGPAVQTGRLPNLKRVADAGTMHAGSVTIFPSITPAATTTLVTGAYPA